MTPTQTPATATRIAPATYSVEVPSIATGLRFTAHGETFEVIGEPFTCGWRLVNVRCRQIDGHSAGNEFGAYLHSQAPWRGSDS